MAESALRRTPLHDLHKSLGAKMVPFAGYDMPVQYAAGIMAGHLHTPAEPGPFPGSQLGHPRVEGRALVGLEGPAAAAVLAGFAPGARGMAFMTGAAMAVDGLPCFVTRSGYTGEDGFEISVPAISAGRLARRLLAEPEVMPVGLGARDSLRLEAGLCLHGHDIDETTSVVEADLAWAIQKRRRTEGGFPGAVAIARQLKDGAPRKRVGIKPEGRAPAREGSEIVDAAGAVIGRITSGGFRASADRPSAQGQCVAAHSALGTPLQLMVRGTPRPARIVPLPFVPHRYHRG